tara:strand:- start:578 stop:745 length:168 start_codon:yes stop_codon:yes gene_type:complete
VVDVYCSAVSCSNIKYRGRYHSDKNIPTPGLEPGPLKDKVLSLACLPISSHRHLI